MITNKKLISVPLASTVLILFLIFVSSTASAATTTCSVVGTNYQYWSGEQYPLIDLFGEKYVPLCEYTNPIWQSHVDKLAKLIIDSKTSYSLTAGESLEIGQGYSLQVKQVDVDGQKVWLEFDKDGQYVDDQIISTDSGDHTWICTLDNIQGVNNVPVLKVHVNQVFQDATDSIAQIDGIWLIDYKNARALQVGNKFGDYTITAITNGMNASNLGSLVFEYVAKITDLGTLGGSDSYANGINDKGQIVGWSYTGTGDSHAFLWQNGVMKDLGTLGGSNSKAYGINDKGQVVGFSSTATGDWHAFLWQNGVMTDLGTLNGSSSSANGINDKGQVVGSSDTGTGIEHAFLWQNGVMKDLGTLGGSNSHANGINDEEQVVGYSWSYNGNGEYRRAFLWQNGVMTDLGTIPGYSDSYANGINDKGQVVGYCCSYNESYYGCASLWQNGVMTDLGTLGGSDNSAEGINNIGQVVGNSDTGTGAKHATLWTLPTPYNDQLTITETQITTSGSASNPRIYGSRIVYEDMRSGKNEIYMYDISTKQETQISTSGSAKYPAICDDRIVWYDSRNGKCDVYMYDLSNQQETQIATSGIAYVSQYGPEIYNDKIVWQEECSDSGLVTNLIMHDLSTQQETQIATSGIGGVSGTGYYGFAIHSDKIVAADPNGDDCSEIVMFDLSAQRTAISGGYYPDIYNDKIVWTDTPWMGNDWNIYIHDLSTQQETQITASGTAHSPAIYGNRIVWTDSRNGGNPDVYMYDLSTSTETQITTSGLAYSPDIYGDRIVWVDNNDIYMATLSYSVLPIADFSSDVTSGYAPLTVSFTDLSENATEWKWDFGDGTTSTDKNTTHTYSAAGNYTVNLTAINANGTDSKLATLTVLKQPVPPIAAYSAVPTFGVKPFNVTFKDKSTGSPTSWSWNFGDGNTSTEMEPVHTYYKAGRYSVSLTVGNDVGSDTRTRYNYIVVM